MRFGIGEKSNHTLEKIGQNFDLTRKRIRQIKTGALRKLRNPSKSEELEAFIRRCNTMVQENVFFFKPPLK